MSFTRMNPIYPNENPLCRSPRSSTKSLGHIFCLSKIDPVIERARGYDRRVWQPATRSLLSQRESRDGSTQCARRRRPIRTGPDEGLGESPRDGHRIPGNDAGKGDGQRISAPARQAGAYVSIRARNRPRGGGREGVGVLCQGQGKGKIGRDGIDAAIRVGGGAAKGRGESSAPRSGWNQRQSRGLDHTTHGCRNMHHSLNCNGRGVDREGGGLLATRYLDGGCAKLRRGVVGTHRYGSSAGQHQPGKVQDSCDRRATGSCERRRPGAGAAIGSKGQASG